MKKILSIPASIGFLIMSASAVFAQSPTPPSTAISIIVNRPANLPFAKLGTLISGGVGIILIIAALAAFVFLIMGGLQWVTSGGDKAKVEEAQNKIQAALIGLFVVFAAWAIMVVVGQVLGIDLYNLSIPKIMDTGK